MTSGYLQSMYHKSGMLTVLDGFYYNFHITDGETDPQSSSMSSPRSELLVGRAEICTRALGPLMSVPVTAALSCLANVELVSLSLKSKPNYVYA